jgi:hypothetical protein
VTQIISDGISARSVSRTTIVQGAELFPSPVIWIPLTGALALAIGVAGLAGSRLPVLPGGFVMFFKTSFDVLLDDHGTSVVVGDEAGLEPRKGVGASAAD